MLHRLQRLETDPEERLDRFLSDKLPEISRGAWRKIIELGGVHLEGRRCSKCGATVKVGENLEVHLDNGPLDPFRLSEKLIVFQDKHLIAINKPAGVETQPTLARYKGTLYEALQAWLQRDRRFGRRLEIGMAQRLDRDTSGVIVFSIHPLAHKGLTSQLQDRTAVKQYLALVSGEPQPASGSYLSRLVKERRSGRMVVSESHGKEALTEYRTLASEAGLSLMQVDLKTGRTHQIRAHFAAAGHPLAGDRFYGGPSSLGQLDFARQCLHSWRLELRHPVTGSPLTFTAPLPSDMQLLSNLPAGL